MILAALLVVASSREHHVKQQKLGAADNHPIPACMFMSVTIAPTDEGAFNVNRYAATGREVTEVIWFVAVVR